jgi:HTH-type transcriptional regulator/antitoxin HipB
MPRHVSSTGKHSSAQVAAELARRRKAKGLTQADLGRRIGLPQSHISRIEHGKTDLRLSSLLDLARLLDLEVMLVPREVVPVVRSVVAAAEGDRRPAGETGLALTESPLYRLQDDQP